MPSEQTAYLWVERTPPEFIFDVKAFRLFTTHPTSYDVLPKSIRERVAPPKKNLYYKDLPAEMVDEMWSMYRHALQPLHQVGKLGVVLLQFPKWFVPSPQNKDHILRCKEQLPDFRVAVEFRSASWLSEDDAERTALLLEENNLAYVCVDEPQGFASSVPPVALVTSDVALVRFHGRNTGAWEASTRTSGERFDYWYQKADFQEWVPKIGELEEKAREVHLLMNTNRVNQAPVNAAQLRMVLSEAGVALA